MASESKDKTFASAARIPAKPKSESDLGTRDGVTRAAGAADMAIAAQTDRESQIAVAAYYKAQHRNFTEGGEITDWLAAEQEVDAYEANRSVAPVEARY